MASLNSSFPPLFERISHKSYFLRAVDLTILGLLFSLLLYRILHMSQNDNVWLVALICESLFSFMWLIITCIRWSPAEDKPYPNRLNERGHDLPSVLSLLALNYPAGKLACYVSDDGCSPLTYFSLKEASKFAKIWIPFCKKYGVGVRAPFRYFLNPLVAAEDSEFSKDWEMIKREYETLSRKVNDATGDSHWLDADDAFSNTKPNDHSTIVKVVWENKGGVGDEKEVPHLLRVSGLMTNAPYMLHVDCDMYANEADVVRQAMCVFLQKSNISNHCAFVQFPQDFYDSNTNEFSVLQSYMGRGVAGIQGTIYCGSGCFHTRRVMYGLSPGDLDDNGNLSSVATREFLDEDSLARKYGNSREMVKSMVEALQRKSNPQNTLANSIEAAHEVGNCHYEYQSSWGKTLGCLHDSVAEDINTSIGIHFRGWTSSYICPDPPAFLGSAPSIGLETIVQQPRWGTGIIEINP
ncbi:unnamed protein product [Thlaspi arvense]|uniref:Uncharacterized protein n=1 Tax=Thlaspi arvense TaxID=13288 RepID=A0AAU9T468_THLAR|nr:unnamed protein product [Thlaspi arvense]